MTTVIKTINIFIIKSKPPYNIKSRHRGGRGIRSEKRENTFGRRKRKWEYNIKIEISGIECDVIDKIFLVQ
jgi:hypothetical protein